jgi:hypothetical protein
MSTKNYWETRYIKGGNSGRGSHDEESVLFKSSKVNEVIQKYNIKSICELGCGDGNQLKFFKGYDMYTGQDISETIIRKCSGMYTNDPTKEFVNEISTLDRFDLAISLDVTYHLVEDSVFDEYMNKLFNISNLVCLYTTDQKNTSKSASHVHHREIKDIINDRFPRFKLVNEVLYSKDDTLFLVYKA